jgi:hypothetical protein
MIVYNQRNRIKNGCTRSPKPCRKHCRAFLLSGKEAAMPMKPKRPCRYPGCPKLTDGLYCEEHAKVMQQHYEKFTRGYSSARGTAEHGNESVTTTFTSILSARCV